MDDQLKQQLLPAIAVFNLAVGIYMLVRMLMGRTSWDTFWLHALIAVGIGIVAAGITFGVTMMKK